MDKGLGVCVFVCSNRWPIIAQSVPKAPAIWTLFWIFGPKTWVNGHFRINRQKPWINGQRFGCVCVFVCLLVCVFVCPRDCIKEIEE